MKKCALINDLSGFGKCSLTAAIPVLSVMGIEAHPLPTAVLSNQTAYDSYSIAPMTDYMMPFIREWKKLNVSFDGILTGYICNKTQIDIINYFIDEFKTENTILVVDPIMADCGKLYDGFTPEIAEGIKGLCLKADVITPNISELGVLAGKPYPTSIDEILECIDVLKKQGVRSIVATGYQVDNTISNIVADGENVTVVSSEYTKGSFSGTGDLLSSILIGEMIKGIDIESSVRTATSFLEKTIKNSDIRNRNDGVDFEKFLGGLAYAE